MPPRRRRADVLRAPPPELTIVAAILAAVGVVVLAAPAVPTRRAVTPDHPARIRTGTDGTLAIFDPDATSCGWLRQEPGGPREDVHRFGASCLDTARLFWNDKGTRGLLVFWKNNQSVTAWQVDLAGGALWELLAPAGERISHGFVAPDGAITLMTARMPETSRVRTQASKLGVVEPCIKGELRAYRSADGAAWTFVDAISMECDGRYLSSLQYGDDYSWSRPGVVSPPKKLPDGRVAPDSARRRGDFAITQHGFAGWELVGVKGAVGPPIQAGDLEFWPAPVHAGQKVEAQPETEW